jgi:hypothetical protein
MEEKVWFVDLRLGSLLIYSAAAIFLLPEVV